ncbi:MAG: polysaccharide biosynthesis/export family protein [Terriglobales bacterium]|jgi:polysaccharide export outer membrane protein
MLSIAVNSKARRVASWPTAKLVAFLSALTLCAVPALHAQQKVETPQQTNEKIQELAAQERTKPHDVPIGTGDLLHIDVFDVPELSREVRVGDAGDISYPLIPTKIIAAGLTPFQLERKLEQLLIDNGLVSHPQVSVFVKEQNSQPVSVVGAVQKPMVYQIVRPTTLLEVLSTVGGITDDAGSFIIVTRAAQKTTDLSSDTENGQLPASDSQIITIRLQDLIESGNPVYNVSVYGGDVISVPRAGIVYVAGSGVQQQGGYVLQSHGDQITAMKAVSLAHGLTSFAKADDAVIFRPNPMTGQNDIIPVHLKQILNRKTPDVPMKSKDLLYVPDNVGLKVLARGAEAGVAIGTGLAIYRGGP